MFNFFPNLVELRQKSFLWAHDLSTYDSILDLPFNIPFYGDHISLFTLLMTASTILYTWSNSQMQAQMQGPMKTMQYLMPIMFLFVLNSYSSGLTFYYFVSNIVSFGQIALLRRFVDEDKILLKLEENRKKNANTKKSGFQQKLADAMRSAEEKQKEQKNKKKQK
jgi:YidC/Oxa1 family membrane protein insertase